MADGFSVDVDGLAELDRRLLALGKKLQTRAARRGVAAGASVIRKEARRIAKAKGIKRHGYLIKNIAYKRERKPKSGESVQYNIGVRHGKHLSKKVRKTSKYQVWSARKQDWVTKYRDDPYYWHWQEFGTVKQQAKPFLRPAWKNKKRESLAALVKKIDEVIREYGGS